MHPTAERYKLLEALDQWCVIFILFGLILGVVLTFAGAEKSPRRWRRICYVVGNRVVPFLVTFGAVAYFWWRLEFGWKGIYHP